MYNSYINRSMSRDYEAEMNNLIPMVVEQTSKEKHMIYIQGY